MASHEEKAQIHVYGGGRPIGVNPDLESFLVMDAKNLIYFSSVDSTKYFATEENWRLSTMGNYILVLFANPVILESRALPRGQGMFRVKEILVPFPDGGSPGHILLREGGSIYSVTKYSPRSLCELIQAARLLSYPPYDQGGLKEFCQQ